MKRRGALVCAALAAAAPALSGCGGDGASTEPPPPPPPAQQDVVRIKVGEQGVAGGPVRATVKQNRRVLVVVESALADEIHLHGYDLSEDVEAGGKARLAFEATIPGTFEIELEDRGLQIGELTVRP